MSNFVQNWIKIYRKAGEISAEPEKQKNDNSSPKKRSRKRLVWHKIENLKVRKPVTIK